MFTGSHPFWRMAASRWDCLISVSLSLYLIVKHHVQAPQLVMTVPPTCSVWPWLRFFWISLTGRCRLYNTDPVSQAGRHSSFAWRSQQTVHPPLSCSWLTSPWRDSPTPEPGLCLLQIRLPSPTPDPPCSPPGSEEPSRISSPGQSGPSSAWCPGQTTQMVSTGKESHGIATETHFNNPHVPLNLKNTSEGFLNSQPRRSGIQRKFTA